jgi:AcrR family transcriptional regulator
MRSQKRILDATKDLIERSGFEAVNIAAVATAAGVTRQTVYTNFGSREELVSQALAGITLDVLGSVAEDLAATSTPYDYLAELIVAGRRALRGDPIMSTLLRAEPGNPILDPNMASRAIPFVHALLGPLVERYPALGTHLDDLVEISMRIGLSVVLFDSDAVQTDRELRRFLSLWLQPGINALCDTSHMA